jgi:DNA-binding XRE family transcriptional regulator
MRTLTQKERPLRKHEVKNFSEKLKAARKKLGLTQMEMADLLGISPHSMFQWEYGFCPKPLSQLGAFVIIDKAWEIAKSK